MQTNKNITVVYLSYLPYGFDSFLSFVDSYIENPAGINHDLLIIFKGVDNDRSIVKPYISFLIEKNIVYKFLFFNKGFDIDAYFFATQEYTADLYYFLNSNSILLSNNWLLNSYKAISRDNTIAIIGSTGSYLSYYSSVFLQAKYGWEFDKGFFYNYRKYKLFLKAFFYWRFLFKSFPNSHIRTNAFIIKKELLSQIKHTLLTTKLKAYQFESGRNSLTNQIRKLGYQFLIIDKKGDTYNDDQWKSSNTFWSGSQENLVVSDNQTRIYDNASSKEKKSMNTLAWGK